MLRTLAAALLAALAPSGALAGDRVAAAAPAEAPASRPVEAQAQAPGVAARDGALAAGRVESQGARVEILGKPVRVGEKLELPEGFIRVEEEGVEDREVGSFSIVPARTLRPESVALAESGGRTGAGAPSPSAGELGAPMPGAMERPCRRERAAYLRELWKASGIEVADPDAVLEGLESGGGGPASGFYWFALATDPFRPLAWSSTLRSEADALARCVRRN